MNPIRNIWEKANVNSDNRSTTAGPLDILEEQANAINSCSEETNIGSVVISYSITVDDVLEEFRHVLYLFPEHAPDYEYQLIEVASKCENEFPVAVWAFHNTIVRIGKCKSEEAFYVALSKIFNDKRLGNVFDELQNV
ncbi:MAG: hypothetical protein EOP04_32425 [Proteobacteria bacterium]|nr:MAG: hypothetical protein EOP04_32425 [Pseudomonadota bacterium]